MAADTDHAKANNKSTVFNGCGDSNHYQQICGTHYIYKVLLRLTMWFLLQCNIHSERIPLKKMIMLSRNQILDY